jgi:hypothetical protein
MGLSVTQTFLVGACRAAGPEQYFRWREVGAGLGYSAEQSEHAVRSLDERGLLVLLTEGNARLCAAGAALATQLETKALRVPRTPGTPGARRTTKA